jgi:hypothetical protein
VYDLRGDDGSSATLHITPANISGGMHISGVAKTPHELWTTGQAPNIRHIRRWVCKCYAHIPKAKRIKDFSYKSHIGYIVGYTNENGHLTYVSAERKVIQQLL